MLNLRLARWRLLLGTSLLATGMNVGAQDAGNRDPMRLAPIRVQDLGINYRSDAAAGTLRSTTPLKDWPQSVQTLNNELLRDQGIYRFDDIYRNITGATQFSNLQDLSIRGFRTQRGQVSFNGMRANPYDGFINPIMANIDRVEVLKGPAALLYGNGSPGGTINMITKKPLARERHEVTGLIAEDQRYRTTFDSTGPVGEDGDLLYRFIGSVDDAESYRNNVEERSWQLAPSLTWLPTDTTTVSLETEVFRVFNKGKRGRGIPAPNGDTGAVPLSFAANEPTDRQVNEGYAAQLTLDQALTRDWDFRLTGRFSESDYDDRYHEPISLRDDKRTMDRQWRDLNYVNDEWNAIAELRGAERLGRFRHELNLGVDLGRKLRRDNFAFVDDPDIEPIDIYDPVYGATNPSEYDYSLDQRTFDTRNRSVYVRDLVSVGRWKFLGGLRYDHFKEQSVRAEGSNDALTGQAGIVYSLTPKHSLYGSYSQGFEPQIPPVDHDGDDGLFEPVESEQFEAGVKSDWFRGRLSTTAAVYQIVRKNHIGGDPRGRSARSKARAWNSMSLVGSPTTGRCRPATPIPMPRSPAMPTPPMLARSSQTRRTMPRSCGPVTTCHRWLSASAAGSTT